MDEDTSGSRRDGRHEEVGRVIHLAVSDRPPRDAKPGRTRDHHFANSNVRTSDIAVGRVMEPAVSQRSHPHHPRRVLRPRRPLRRSSSHSSSPASSPSPCCWHHASMPGIRDAPATHRLSPWRQRGRWPCRTAAPEPHQPGVSMRELRSISCHSSDRRQVSQYWRKGERKGGKAGTQKQKKTCSGRAPSSRSCRASRW
jgi:hypothetical protein